jgi:hypothetical protein
MRGPLPRALARGRRVEPRPVRPQIPVNWLDPADQDPLETTGGFEQVAIEVTASVARSAATRSTICASPAIAVGLSR